MIDFSQALQHPTEDRDWPIKVLIGALINLVPILNFALTGFLVEHFQNSAAGTPAPLPNWDRLGRKMLAGLKILVVQIVFALPILVPSCALLAFVAQQAAVRSGEALPQNVLAGAGIIGLALICFALIYGLFLAYLFPAIFIQFARTQQIGPCLRIGELLSIARVNTGDYLLIIVMAIVIVFVLGVASTALSLIPCLGTVLVLVLTSLAKVYTGLVLANMAGQYVYNVSSDLREPSEQRMPCRVE